MATRPILPYYAPAEQLPAPLPTVAEILASKTRLSQSHEAPVFRVGDHFAVKYGKHTSLQEGENMLFVQQSSRVSVPKVYAIFHDEATKTNYIILEFIPGKNLGHVWNELGTSEKRDIMSQLGRHMDELRSIPSQGFYGGIWRQPTLAYHFQDGDLMDHPHPDVTISGPQETEEQWTDAMWRYLDARVTAEGARSMLPLRRQVYHDVFKGHKPVFTHANILKRNIMLRDDGTVVIVDWENAGWYPSYWEYCTAMLILNYKEDWGQWLVGVLDKYNVELCAMILHSDMIFWST
ncbi:kinase-like domain-containing protein [Chaetomidium leptoderma]|uniref:Kinase-like domain-containing protein n=1 Tax=Chaetomidium leptoderma TaxID=669021 RepID=A0AAN6VWS6_9PEZI|nr:kinase-like domain-containing protein [Chaetomidium leptoderma]